MHPLAVAAAVQDAAGELVDDEHLTVDHDVVLVLFVKLLGLQRVVQETDQRGVHRLVEVLDAEQVLDGRDAVLGDGDGALLLVHLVVLVAFEARDHTGELGVPPAALVGGAADDQRRAGLVDEDRVDLVDDRVVVAALHELVGAPGHVVAQVVEAELVIGAVGDVGGVGRPALLRGHLWVDHADAQPEEAVDAAHVLGVALGQIVVHRDDVHALAGERVEIGGQRGDQRLALTGLHLGDVAQVQCPAAHDLHVEVPLAQRAFGRLPHGGERFGKQVVEGFAVCEPLPVLVGHRPQLRVGHRLEVGFERVDLLGDRLEPAQDAALAGTQQPVQYHGGDSSITSGREWPRLRQS